MIKHIMTRAGIWHTTNKRTIKKNKFLAKFVKTIDFTKLQSTSHCVVKYKLEHKVLRCNGTCCE